MINGLDGDLWNGTRFDLKWKKKRMTLVIAYDCGVRKKIKKEKIGPRTLWIFGLIDTLLFFLALINLKVMKNKINLIRNKNKLKDGK